MWVLENNVYVYRKYKKVFMHEQDEFYANDNMELILRRVVVDYPKPKDSPRYELSFGVQHPTYLNVLCSKCGTAVQYIGDMVHCSTCNSVGNIHKIIDRDVKDKVWVKIE